MLKGIASGIEDGEHEPRSWKQEASKLIAEYGTAKYPYGLITREKRWWLEHFTEPLHLRFLLRRQLVLMRGAFELVGEIPDKFGTQGNSIDAESIIVQGYTSALMARTTHKRRPGASREELRWTMFNEADVPYLDLDYDKYTPPIDIKRISFSTFVEEWVNHPVYYLTRDMMGRRFRSGPAARIINTLRLGRHVIKSILVSIRAIGEKRTRLLLEKYRPPWFITLANNIDTLLQLKRDDPDLFDKMRRLLTAFEDGQRGAQYKNVLRQRMADISKIIREHPQKDKLMLNFARALLRGGREFLDLLVVMLGSESLVADSKGREDYQSEKVVQYLLRLNNY